MGQKLVTKISTDILLMISESMDALSPKDTGIITVEQILFDKAEKVQKMELKQSKPREWFRNGHFIGYTVQKTLVEVLNNKMGMQMTNQNNDLENIYLVYVQKRRVNTLKK